LNGGDIATDATGSIYVTASFDGTADFDGIKLISKGDRDIFIAKYNPDGTIAWANRAGGEGEDEGNSIALDDEGNIYVTGYISSKASDFGNIILSDTGKYSQCFFAKY